MSQIVAAISMSHAPGMLGWPDAPKPAMRAAIEAAVAEIARYLDAARPDVIVAVLDDHFENHYRNLMPAFSIGVAPAHVGPADYWMKMLKIDTQWKIAGEPILAEFLLRALVKANFDMARMGAVEYGNNLCVPLKLIRPRADIPIVPVFINVFSPPLPSVARAYAFGEALRQAIEAAPGNQRVALLATGGLSHWPPVWRDDIPPTDAFMQRMRRFQTEGRPVLKSDPELLTDLGTYEIEMARTWNRPLVNAEWDRKVLAALGRGDADSIRALTFEEVDENAGNGGHEILNWAAVMGAMGGRPARVLEYQPCVEWICGMGFLVYDF